jgi:hypothetical protein
VVLCGTNIKGAITHHDNSMRPCIDLHLCEGMLEYISFVLTRTIRGGSRDESEVMIYVGVLQDSLCGLCRLGCC